MSERIRPQSRNANRHNQRGMQALETSIATDGWIGAITVAADGETFDGSARVEKTAENGMLDSAIIVDSDGTRPIVVRRTDIATADDPRAKRLGIAANRVAALNLEWEPAILAELAGEVDLSGLFYPDELADLATPVVAGAGGDTEDVDDVEIDDLLSPFPWFGGKARVAARVWARFGGVDCYVEPFCGSAAVLLACPYDIPTRTVNDADGFIANFWRAVEYAPAEVAHYADWPVNENDLFARHVWLIKQDVARKLETDPEWYDAKIAGWWVWGCCAWIGTGWCSGEGPWIVENNEIVNRKLPHLGNAGQGVNRKLPHLGDAGQGVNRQLPHLGNAGQGVKRQLPHLGDAGRGVNRQLPHLGNAGRGVNRKLPHLGDAGQGDCAVWSTHIQEYTQRLSDKLRRVRVACGDWARVTTESVTTRHGITAVLLDPPYGEGAQEYSAGGNADKSIAADVWQWAIANGDDPQYRIAVCGYEDGRTVPVGWSTMRWKARKGYQVSDENSAREVIWFSPHCLDRTDTLQ